MFVLHMSIIINTRTMWVRKNRALESELILKKLTVNHYLFR